jgi:PKD repeat protein
MKQVANATTGMVVLAADIPDLTYLHGCAGGPCPAPAVAPVANFTASPLSGAAPLTVNFTDTSTNSPTSWSWTFGDGGTSTAKNPSHTYSDAGTYSVTLTATNSAGGDGETKSGYITVGAPVAATYQPINPFRLLDTRNGTGGLSGKFLANVPRTFNVAGAAGSGIPANAVAVTGNLTVVSQTAAGYVALGPVSDSTPSFSTLNFPLGDTRGNGVTVPLNASGDLSAVYKAPTGKSTHLILDVTGYFLNGTTKATFDTPADPLRMLDSRNGTGGLSGPFQATVPRTFDVGGVAGIPAGAVAVTGNLTVVGQTQAGYVALGPVADSTPSYSTLNFPLGDTRGNGVTVQLAANGNLSAVYMAQPGKTAHLVFDVTGFFIAGTSGASFVPVDPARIVDTRIALGVPSRLVHAQPRTWDAAGHHGVGSDATAIVGNATVVSQTKAGYVVLTPTPEVAPTLSTLNFPLGDVRGNAFTVGATSGNVSSVYRASAGATTHFIVDVTGYYR